MKILVIGGTRFVGRHIAQAAIAAGADVTLFHRGSTPAHGMAGVTEVLGDRNRDLHRLGDTHWDAVIDTCGYTPVETEIAARYFASRTGRYVFISTISVYEGTDAARVDEDSPVDRLPKGADRTRMTPEHYGALKVLCEQIVNSTFRNGATIARPHLVAGPHDPTDRFTYWPLRVAAGGTVLAPESAEQHLQYIDARDLAAFVMTLITRDLGGTYNVCTMPAAHTFGELLTACRRASNVCAGVHYLSLQTLEQHGVQPWSDLPLWLPSSDRPLSAILRASNRRARSAGSQLRSLDETARDTLLWARSAGKRLGELAAGLTPLREHEILAKTSHQIASAR